LGEFKKGAFIFAIDIGVPILPVTVINTGRILPPHTWNLLPGRAKLIIHKKIDVTGYRAENINEFLSKARETIQSGLDRYS
jgi:1-acyl-sn-glycerol-3-phosphate acyltransferase